MKEFETIVRVLVEKVEKLEMDVYIKNIEIKHLKKELEEAKKND